MGTERVTIGITCFNARSTIERALRSAQAQDWPNLEILIVDDGSTDGSVELVGQLVAGDGRARLIRHACNSGTAAARNTIIEHANGDFIAFFDDDDESLPVRVSRQMKAIERLEKEGKQPVACYAGGERRYPNGYVKALPAIGAQGDPPHGPAVANYLLFYERRPEWFYGAGVPTCALMARRETFRKLGGFDLSLRRVEDVDFAIRLTLTGGWFIGTPEKLFIQYATQSADKTPDANHRAEIAIVEKHATYLRGIGRYHYARRWPNLRYYHFKRQYGRFVLEFLAICARNPVLAIRHLMETGPRRLRHERLMNKRMAI